MKIAKKLARVDCCDGTERGLCDNSYREQHFLLRIKERYESYHFLVRLCAKESNSERFIPEKMFLIALETRYRMNRLNHLFYAPHEITKWSRSYTIIAEHIRQWRGSCFYTWIPSLELVIPEDEDVHLKKLQSFFGTPTSARVLFPIDNDGFCESFNPKGSDIPGFENVLERKNNSRLFDEYRELIDPYFFQEAFTIADVLERLRKVWEVSDFYDLQTLLLLERCSLENRQAILNVFVQEKGFPDWALAILQRK